MFHDGMAIICANLQEAEQLMETLEAEEYRWQSGALPTEVINYQGPDYAYWLGEMTPHRIRTLRLAPNAHYARWEIVRFYDIIPNSYQPEIHSLADFL